MSVELMGQVWHLALPNHLVLVLLALSDHADDDGTNVYPSIARLAWKTGQSERGAQRALKTLRDLGIAIRVGVKRHGTVEYRLDFDNVKRKAPWLSRSDNMSYPEEPESPNDTDDVSKTQEQVGHVVPAEADTGDGEVGHVVPAEADTGVLQNIKEAPLESSSESSFEKQAKETLPDYMLDLRAVNDDKPAPKHPFKKTQAEMVTWMSGKGITPRKADETAAYIKGNWPGPRKSWKDVAAVFRTLVVKTWNTDQPTGTGTRRSRSDNLPTTEELKNSWG